MERNRADPGLAQEMRENARRKEAAAAEERQRVEKERQAAADRQAAMQSQDRARQSARAEREAAIQAAEARVERAADGYGKSRTPKEEGEWTKEMIAAKTALDVLMGLPD